MTTLPAVTVTVEPDPIAPLKQLCVKITIHQHRHLPLQSIKFIDYDVFKSYFDQVMEELINTIHKFYAEKGHIK